MTNLLCRLCSSTHSLLSVFSGKRKLFRNYIQSLTSYTIGIKFEKHDLRKYICYTCVVQVYNCYVFKISSMENEKKFQATLNKNNGNVEETSREDTDHIKLPTLDELKQAFLPWLLSKQSSDTGVKQNEDKVKHNFVQTDLSLLNMVNTHSQCDIQVMHHKNEVADKDILTSFDCHLQKSHISCQTIPPTSISQENYGNARAIVKTADVFSQTDCVQFRTTEVQTTSRGRKRKNGSIPCSLKEKKGNNGDILQKKRRLPKIIKSAKNGLKKYSLADIVELKDVAEIHFVRDIKQLSNATEASIFSSANEEKPKLKCQENQSIKEEIIKSDDIDQKMKVESTKELLPNAKVKTTFDKNTTAPVSKTLCIDLESQEYLSPKSSGPLPLEQVSTKELLPNGEVKANLGKMTALSKSFCIDQQSQIYLSPKSSGLLSVKDKVEYVQVCTLCDLTLYSKNEMRSHWRKHLNCRYCQLRFTSLKKVKVHMAAECEKRLIPKIPLIPLEKIDDIKAKYPYIVQVLCGKRKRSDSSA